MTTIEGVPGIPGLRFRHYRADGDAAAFAAVRNAETAAAGIDEYVTAEEVAADLAHASGEDPARTLVVAEADGRVVAYARRSWHDRSELIAYEHVGHVHPDVQRRGLGRALLRHQAAALRDLAAADAARHAAAEGVRQDGEGAAPDRERVFFSWTDTRCVGAVALLESEGYAPVRWYVDLERPTLAGLPEAAVPDGIELRTPATGDTTLLRAALAAEDEAFRDHWGHHPMTGDDVDAVLAEPDHDPTLWRIAWDGDAIAGVIRALVYAEENARFGRARVWIDHLSVRRPWRGRGIARALMVDLMADARDRGLTSAGLGVDTDNTTGALGLYERLGFERRSVVMACARPIDVAGARG